MKRWIFALSLAVSGPVLAAAACDKPRNDFDALYCLNKIYQEADKELNANYKALAPRLDTDDKAHLKTGQLAWMKDRNANCSRRDGSSFLVDLQCATDITIARSQFLQDRLRECKSAGCLNIRL